MAGHDLQTNLLDNLPGREQVVFIGKGIMTTHTSFIWTVILVAAQMIVVGELIAVCVTPLARQFTGWSILAAMLCLLSISLLLIASPFFWRSHRRLAISGLCVGVGAIVFTILPW